MRAWSLLFLSACMAGFEPGLFDPPFVNTHMVLDVASTDGTRSPLQMQTEGEQTVGGTTLPVVVFTNQATGAPTGLSLVATIDGAEVSLGGVTIDESLAGIAVRIEAAEPLVVDLSSPVGQPQTARVDGTVTLGDPTVPTEGYLPFDVTWTVQDTAATAPAPMGDVTGCRHATFEASTAGLSATGELWTRDDVGFVHAVLDTEPWGRVDAGASGWFGFDEAAGTAVITGEGRLDAANPSWTLDTYQVANAFDADKNVHSQMWMELRWADAERARTTEPVPVTQTFYAMFGYFPSLLVQSPTSVLHPDEDEGFTYWAAFVDQAAKNDPAEGGITYSMSANHDGSDGAVLVGGFIRYHKIAP